MPRSDPPKSSDKIKLEIPWKGISIPWKAVVVIFLILTGIGGGYTVNDLRNGNKNPPKYFTEHCEEQKKKNVELEKADEELDSGIKEMEERFNERFEKIETIQINDVSRREARRVVEAYKASPQKKADKFIEIYELNVKRLGSRKPKEPCSDWRCSN